MVDDLEFRITKLQLSPGDVLVAKCHGRITRETAQGVHDQIEPKLPGGNKVLVVDSAIEFSVITRGEIEAKAA